MDATVFADQMGLARLERRLFACPRQPSFHAADCADSHTTPSQHAVCAEPCAASPCSLHHAVSNLP
jgi:hypothetical protein